MKEKHMDWNREAIIEALQEKFFVPNEDHFQLMPKEEQHRIIGQGEVMAELKSL